MSTKTGDRQIFANPILREGEGVSSPNIVSSSQYRCQNYWTLRVAPLLPGADITPPPARGPRVSRSPAAPVVFFSEHSAVSEWIGSWNMAWILDIIIWVLEQKI